MEGMGGNSFGPVIIYRADDYFETAEGPVGVCLMLLVDGDGV
jgi:hypothetical protein